MSFASVFAERSSNLFRTGSVLVLVALLPLAQAPAQTPPGTRVLVLAGDPAPDGNGTFSISLFVAPVLNDTGQIVFKDNLDDTIADPADDGVIFRLDGSTTPVQIARESEPSPSGDGPYRFFRDPTLNVAGRVAFLGITQFADATPEQSALVCADGAAPPVVIARVGDVPPGGNGTFTDFDDVPTLNDAGQLAFRADIDLGDGGSRLDESGIYVGDGSTALNQIARVGQAAPDGDGVFASFRATVGLNSSGQTAFSARVSDTVFGDEESGVFRGESGAGGITQIARRGQPAPDADGTFATLHGSPAINDVGEVAFSSSFIGTTLDEGLFRADGAGGITEIARVGDPVPGGNGTFDDIEGDPALSELSPEQFRGALDSSGRIVFVASLAGTTGGAADDSGLYRGDGTPGGLVEIAREGQTAPGGNGTFVDFAGKMDLFGSLVDPLINDAGQVAFGTRLENTVGGDADNRAVYFFDDSRGLIPVIRTGDPFLGSTVVAFGLLTAPGGRDGFNNAGQIAYYFRLADDRDGFALWNSDGATPPPTPTPTPTPPVANPTPPVVADTQKPNLRIRGRKTIETLRKRVVIRGTASDASSIAEIDVKARGAKVGKVKLKSDDRFKIVLRITRDTGRVVVQVRAIDAQGLRSKKSKVRILRR